MGLSHEVNSKDGLNYHDWIPVDGETWAVLRAAAAV